MFEYFTTVKSGKFQKNVTEQIRKDLLNFEGKRVKVRIEKLGETRTIRQNSYLHALFGIFSKEMVDYTGDEMYTPAKIKSMMKTKFLLRDVVSEKTGLVTGQEVLRTRDLNKEDFAIFVEQVIRYAAMEYHFTLPYPGEEMELILD